MASVWANILAGVLSNPNQNRTGNEKMNFTNTDCLEHDICWQVKAQLCCYVWNQVNEQVWNQVDHQVSWKRLYKIIPIQRKIEQELNK